MQAAWYRVPISGSTWIPNTLFHSMWHIYLPSPPTPFSVPPQCDKSSSPLRPQMAPPRITPSRVPWVGSWIGSGYGPMHLPLVSRSLPEEDGVHRAGFENTNTSAHPNVQRPNRSGGWPDGRMARPSPRLTRGDRWDTKRWRGRSPVISPVRLKTEVVKCYVVRWVTLVLG